MSVNVLIVKPIAFSTMNVPMSETGIARITLKAEEKTATTDRPAEARPPIPGMEEKSRPKAPLAFARLLPTPSLNWPTFLVDLSRAESRPEVLPRSRISRDEISATVYL